MFSKGMFWTIFFLIVFCFCINLYAIPYADNGRDMQQFTAGGHVLGFRSNDLYVAAGDHVFKTTFVGANPVVPRSSGPPSKNGRVKPLGTVTYENLWDGITLQYGNSPAGVAKSSYYISPGADVSQIRLRYNADISVDAGGSLVFHYKAGQMCESAPLAWQEKDGRRIPVDISVVTYTHNEAGFAVADYDPAAILVIDPVLSWNTFLGGGGDCGTGIVLDESGNIFITGYSSGPWGSPVSSYGHDVYDIFVAKLDGAGSILWHTFLGGEEEDRGWGIGIDGSGDVYVMGTSMAAWGSPLNPYVDLYDMVVAKLNGVTGVLQWHTFLGSRSSDKGHDIAVDSDGNVYVTGFSNDTWGSPVREFSGVMCSAVVAKLNTSGALQWHTFLNGPGSSIGYGITIDGSCDVYVVGAGLMTWGSPVDAYVDLNDGFAAKLNGTTGSLIWNTFMGSSRDDWAHRIFVDAAGNSYKQGTPLLHGAVRSIRTRAIRKPLSLN